jgi:hypothetical protein
MDLLNDEVRQETSASLPKELDHVWISAITGQGIPQLKDKVWGGWKNEGAKSRYFSHFAKKMSAAFLCGAWVGVGDKSAFTTDIKRIRRKKHKCLWLLCSMICYFPRKNLVVPVFF